MKVRTVLVVTASPRRRNGNSSTWMDTVNEKKLKLSAWHPGVLLHLPGCCVGRSKHLCVHNPKSMLRQAVGNSLA
jgi:hypothetical protein